MKKILYIFLNILLFLAFISHVGAMSVSAYFLEPQSHENFHMMEHQSKEDNKNLHECCQDDDSFEACIEIGVPHKSSLVLSKIQQNISLLPVFYWKDNYSEEGIYYSQSPPENSGSQIFSEKQVSLYTPLTGISRAIL